MHLAVSAKLQLIKVYSSSLLIEPFSYYTHRVCFVVPSVFFLVFCVEVWTGTVASFELCHDLLALHSSRGIVVSDSITL